MNFEDIASNLEEIGQIFSSFNLFPSLHSNIKYRRIKIERRLPNGKLSPIVIETPFLLSFGVSERKNQETDHLNGYSIPVCLWKRDEKPNQEEKDFYDAINKIHEICRDNLEKNFGDNEATSLGEILYYKHIEYQNSKGKTKKKKDESSSPVLYVKFIYSDKIKKILTIFRTKGNKSIDPFDYLNQYFNTKMAIIFESIYLAKNIISLQIKEHEVYIKPLKPRESILEIKESDDEDDYESDNEDKPFDEDEDNVFEA